MSVPSSPTITRRGPSLRSLVLEGKTAGCTTLQCLNVAAVRSISECRDDFAMQPSLRLECRLEAYVE